KACFCNDIIPFVKNLKDLFTSFDQCMIDEVTEVQKIFKQMEIAVEQHRAEKTKFQTKMENVLKENDRLLTHALSVEIVNIVVHDCMNVNCLNVDACEHCVTTESKLKTDFIKKEYYETLLEQYHSFEKHCISLEVNNQLNTEIFQRDTVSSSESAPTFAELFENNELKAQIQEKDTVILKLKEKIKSLCANDKERKEESKVKELETLNLELDHKVDVVPLVPKLRKNRTAHIDYIKHTLEEAATLRELVNSERLLSPLNTPLAYAVNLVSSASGSLSQDNTKNNRIRQTQKKAKKNKVEDHLRTIKSSVNKASVVDSKATSFVLNYVSNVNYDLKWLRVLDVYFLITMMHVLLII
nr:hypothetical protein [Tanacetum cinerariifolium]